ncbi:hypothetical protein V5799_007422 [Amblyomma americanum]|uniref:DNA mismatch repair protein MutS core domain-containing protein n=1 Tax=Amblyomma americanum TaxID=6943 RepID=A0AAQ4FG40_AMBAM
MHDLELLTNTLAPRSSVSLFGVLNNAKTPGGSRLLRVNILQPPRELATIVQRQKAVQQILDSEEFFYSFQVHGDSEAGEGRIQCAVQK